MACDFCKDNDLGKYAAIVRYYKDGTLERKVTSYTSSKSVPDEDKFKFCPICGDSAKQKDDK